jgi:hypothetical protein
VRDTQQLAARACERRGSGVGRSPLGDDVVVRDVVRTEPGGDEVAGGRFVRRELAVDGL